MTEKLLDDIENYLTCLQMVTYYPEKNSIPATSVAFECSQSDYWITYKKQMLQSVRGMALESETDEEKMNSIVKLLLIKDNLKMQLFQGLLYIKMKLWRDLNITAGSKGNKITYDRIAVADMHSEITTCEEKQGYLAHRRSFVPLHIDNDDSRSDS